MANWKSACMLSMTTGPVVYHQGNLSGPVDWDQTKVCSSLQKLGRRLVSKMMPWYVSQLPRAVPEPTKKTTCEFSARPGIKRTQRSLHLFWRCAGAFQPELRRQGVKHQACNRKFIPATEQLKERDHEATSQAATACMACSSEKEVCVEPSCLT